MSFKERMKEKAKRNQKVEELLEEITKEIESTAEKGEHIYIEYFNKEVYSYEDMVTVIEILKGEDYELNAVLRGDDFWEESWKVIVDWMN